MSVVSGAPSGGGSGVASGQIPARADGVELIGELPGSGYRQPPALVRRADGQTIQLTRLLYLVLEAVDGRRTYDDIAARVSTAFGRLVSADDVRTLVDGKLRPLGVLQLADGSQPQVRKADPLLGLRMRYVVTDPAVTQRLTAPFATLFNPLVVVVVLAAFAVVTGWVLFDKGLASATYQAFDRPGLLLLVFAITVVSAGFHEFGHAAAARYGGATPGAMGFALYLVWPAFYTDVTDSYRLGKAGRVRTDLGGLYFNAIVAVAMVGVWWATGWDALLLIVATQILQMVRQLSPVVRFDGYHVLADLTGVPDLYHHIGPTLRGLLPHRWGNPESKILKPWARAVVAAWVIVVVPLLLACLVLVVVALPRVIGTAFASLGRQWDLLAGDYADGDPAGMLVRVLAALAIVLPLLGIGYLLVRLARQVTGRVWRATAGRPAHRTLAAVVAASVVLALAWAWWPDADRYRPVQPYERGTVLDAVPAVFQTPLGGQEGRRGTALTAWPGGAALPTAERPALALVLVPASGGAGAGGSAGGSAGDGAGAPTWVFPFDRPPAPRDGDNQALAVNTTDGSVRYEVAFALVWVTDGTVDSRNEAYALANCRDCTTVAVAFQVVLVLGQADIVVPQNVAVAVNYSCVECMTYALASQLVITLPGALSDDTMAELSRVWAEMEAFGRTIQGMPLSQLQVTLEQFKARIVQIVQQEAEAVPGGPASGGSVPSSTGAATGGPAPSATTAPAGGAATSAGPEPSSTQPPTSAAVTTEPATTSPDQPSQPPSTPPVTTTP